MESCFKVLLVLVVIIIYRYRSHAIGARRRNDLKEPKGALPLLGHAVVLASVPESQLHQFFEKQHNELGSVWSMTLPFLGRVIHIDDPANIDQVLKTNFWSYIKGPMFNDTLGDLFGDGIVTAEGAKWKCQRRIATHIFSTKTSFLDLINEVFVTEGKKVIDRLGRAADTGEVVDLQALMLDYTLECLGVIALGKNFGCLDNAEEIASITVSLDYMLSVIGRRLVDPVWKFRERFNGVREKVKMNREVVRKYAREIIENRKTEGSQKVDLLQMFLESYDDEGQPLSEDVVIDNVITFMIAGNESTGGALTWTFYLIFRYEADKQIANILAEEADYVFGRSDPMPESHKNLKFAKACFYEALRLFPALPRNMRISLEDNILPDGTKVYAGEYVFWSTYAMGRNELLWGPDAKDFKPSRWIETQKPSPAKFNAFGAGPRVCIGQQFSSNQASKIIGMILQSFDMKLAEPLKVREYGTSLALPMKDGLRVRVSRRHQPEP